MNAYPFLQYIDVPHIILWTIFKNIHVHILKRHITTSWKKIEGKHRKNSIGLWISWAHFFFFTLVNGSVISQIGLGRFFYNFICKRIEVKSAMPRNLSLIAWRLVEIFSYSRLKKRTPNSGTPGLFNILHIASPH